jgi:phosphoribosyl-ATP pyrophosphohydrolase
MSNDDNPSILNRLMAVIEERRADLSARSYTTSLLKGGVDKIGAKILEEANEVVEAARETTDDHREHVIHEAADLIYHLFVLLGYSDVSLQDVEAELARRFGVSGLDEKASRGTANDAQE